MPTIGAALGALDNLGTHRFKETKSVTSGEGGALNVNKESMPNRLKSFARLVRIVASLLVSDREIHVKNVGSSFMSGELMVAFLSAHLDEAQEIVD